MKKVNMFRIFIIILLITIINIGTQISALGDNTDNDLNALFDELRHNQDPIKRLLIMRHLEIQITKSSLISNDNFVRDELTKLMQFDKQASVRSIAAELIGMLGGSKAYTLLINALRDDGAKCGAIDGLRYLNDYRAVPRLIDILKNFNHRDLVKELGKLNEQIKKGSLTSEELKDNHMRVANCLANIECNLTLIETLKKLTGKDYGEDYEKWRQWWEGE